MSRWWMGAALTLGWLSVTASAPAQSPMPEPMPMPPAQGYTGYPGYSGYSGYPGYANPAAPYARPAPNMMSMPAPPPVYTVPPIGQVPPVGCDGPMGPTPSSPYGPGSPYGAFPPLGAVGPVGPVGPMKPGMPPSGPPMPPMPPSPPMGPMGPTGPMPPMGPGGQKGPGGPPPGCGPAMSGPLNPQAAPAGPPGNLGLSSSLPGAFTNCPPCGDEGVYFNIGAQGLSRQRPGHLPTATLNTGAPRPAEDAHEIDPQMGWGVRATLGYYMDNEAIEATGFWIDDNHNSVTAASRSGQLSVPVTGQPSKVLLDPQLFQRATFVQTTLTHSVGSGEVNCRSWDRLGSGVEVLFGLRYLDIEEKLGILAEDGNAETVTGQATDFTRTHNHIIAPQLGFDFNKGLTKWMTIGATAKVALGADFVDEDFQLRNGNGSQQQSRHQSFTAFSEVYEIDAYLEFWLWERCRFKGGYMALWATDIANVNQAVDFNLSDTLSPKNRHGSIFYHGPMLELEFLF